MLVEVLVCRDERHANDARIPRQRMAGSLERKRFLTPFPHLFLHLFLPFPALFLPKAGAATGIRQGMKFTGKSFDQAANDWAVKNIYQKTKVRIENLSKATATIAEEGGSRIVPHLDEIKGIRILHFRIEGNDPILMRHVNDQINQLRTQFPEWKFTVEFGT